MTTRNTTPGVRITTSGVRTTNTGVRTAPFIAVVPARLGSTRLPRKPLADIAGVPMVVHVARRAADAGALRVIVATDSEEIALACRAHDVEAIMTSPAHATGTDRLAEIVIRHQIAEDTIVVNVQGDEPLIPPELIRACARLLAARSDCEIATAAFPIANGAEFLNPNVVKVALDATNRALYFSRAPIPWPREHQITIKGELPAGLPAMRHIGIYAYRASFLKQFPTLEVPAIETFECLEQLRALANGYKIAVHRARAAPPPGVDTLEDLQRVRQVLAQAK